MTTATVVGATFGSWTVLADATGKRVAAPGVCDKVATMSAEALIGRDH
jgi:hypothetical protein